MRLIVSILTTVVFLLEPFSQNIEISGRVSDKNTGQGLPGVSIFVKGSTKGVISDMEGNYALKVDTGNILVFSYLGYSETSITVDSGKVVNIHLEPEISDMDEIVVIGYGNLSKKDITGSISSLKFNEVQEKNGFKPANELLQGRAAGVYVQSNSGVPGGAVSINIRGVSSINSNTQPLFVIDGIIVDETSGDITDIDMTPANPLLFLSPEDIATIDVLKDASATAIYGSRGANGVIQITTKKGVEGKNIIRYSVSTSFSEIVKKLDVLDGPSYINYRNDLEYASTGSSIPVYPDTANYVWTDWQGEFFEEGAGQKHRIVFSGGKDRSSYYIALGYLKSKGIINTTGIDKLDFRINYTKPLNKNIKLGTNIAGSSSIYNFTTGVTDFLGDRSLIGSIITSNPLQGDSLLDENGNIDYEGMEVNSPYAWISDYRDNSEERVLVSKFSIDADILSWLNYTGQLGFDMRLKERKRYWGKRLNKGLDYNGVAELNLWENMHWIVDNIVTARKNINQHRLLGTMVFSLDKKLNTQRKFRATNFPDDNSNYEAMHEGTNQYLQNIPREPAQYTSAMFRGMYGYKNLVVTFNGRADGSSKFTNKNKWGYFTSAAAAYNFHQLMFLKNSRIVSNMKLRFGWGTSGNSNTSSYASKQIITIQGESELADNEHEVVLPDTRSNVNITWETTEQMNIGLDLGFFNNKVILTTEAYNKNTRNLLQQIPISYSTGYDYMWVNKGVVSNKGLEFDFKYIISERGLKAAIGTNFAFNRNSVKNIGFGVPDHNGQILYLGNAIGRGTTMSSPINAFIEDRPMGVFWGYKTDGITQAGDTITMFGEEIMPGNINILDVSGPEGVSDSVIDSYDITIIGNPNPRFVYGIEINIGYKNLELQALFQGVYGRDIFNANYVNLHNHHKEKRNKVVAAYTEAWTEENRSNTYPRLDMSDITIDRGRYTDRWVEDGSYLKLGNLSFRYQFKPKRVPVIKDIELNVAITNVFILTKYKGFDPEVDSFISDPLIRGVDKSGFPAVRTYSFGLSVGF